MKIFVEKSNDRGKSDLDWLKSRFSYSFADYYNEKRQSFGDLRVVNDDIIAAGKGFGLHSHNNMEIITIVTRGTLSHKDSLGSKGDIQAGEIQVMSAGSGITHSEFNNSKNENAELFQIWIQTAKRNVTPRYDQKKFNLKQNDLTEVVSGKNNKNTLFIHQDAKISVLKLDKDQDVTYNLPSKKGLFVMIIEGSTKITNKRLERRDAVEISETELVEIKALQDSYLFLIEVNL